MSALKWSLHSYCDILPTAGMIQHIPLCVCNNEDLNNHFNHSSHGSLGTKLHYLKPVAHEGKALLEMEMMKWKRDAGGEIGSTSKVSMKFLILRTKLG